MLRGQISDALKDAMRAKEARTVGALRLILAKLKDQDIAARPRGVTDGIPDEEILQMLQSMIKQRRESIALYEQGGRQELADQERDEIAVIERFLPRQMDEADTRAAIGAAIAATGAAGVKDMGKVMAELRARHAWQMDFGKASALVKGMLG
jgi:uncharacterized protein YqeY